MILPLILGFITGKAYGKNVKVILLSLLIGVAMGIISGLELIPFAYPLYATRPSDWIGVPEGRPIAIYFGFPFFKLHQEVVYMTTFSGFIITVLTVVCLLGVLIGYSLGNRFCKKNEVWSSN